ncbi:hypothetical protein MRO55_14595 [Escherichia coli]|nr:hypothetical protein [Escherichia coli]MCQ7027911.1 hypothetical protein [Escherichia coli]
MKQMSLIEMDGFLKGKCIPRDLKVNETNAEYLVRKFGELESKLETALRECRSAGITIDNLEAKCAALAVENAGLKAAAKETLAHWAAAEPGEMEQMMDKCMPNLRVAYCETPATDAILAEVRAQAHKEGAHFVANRMLAAWEAGFIEDTAKNAADIARMILTSTEFMADAPEGDFDRSFADGVLEDIAAQLRKGGEA